MVIYKMIKVVLVKFLTVTKTIHSQEEYKIKQKQI
jgi:hypothetical protein